MAAISYYLLQQSIIAIDGPGSVLKRAIGSDWKGKASPFLYITGMVAAYRLPWLAQAIYVLAAIVWLVPDRRIERAIGGAEA
jgi:cobalamin synthase